MNNPIDSNRPEQVTTKTNRRDFASEQIKHYIRSHRMQPGELLPPIRAFSEHLDISRDAVWRALRVLQEEKWVRPKANKRYLVSDDVYTEILRSLRVRAVFSGNKYIYFSGFRRLADALKKECDYHNLELEINLLPLEEEPPESIWKDCDALLIGSRSSSALLKHSKGFDVPVIGLDADYSDRYFANIVTDHHQGGRMAAERLILQGSKSICIAHFGGSENNPRIKARIDGFRLAWLEAGRPEDSLTVAPIEWDENNFKVALNIQNYLKSHPPKSDFFVTDGRLAVTFLEVLGFMDVSIPEGLRLIGYDGAQMGGMASPPMTTIQQDMDKIAQMAIARVGQIAESSEGESPLVRVAPLLIERLSG
ncbi:substrate-binding domain-containing protein [Puniceicoccales bacterium CK1056]|uniref:Substrate-binding domain-containing protein n=1 Tax=Oceanipulchritudo coccoides TaxID=2706888 RepID=A0A6B2LZL9_9BACT|nr:substrate-binding domain-containing protein [Oceanipulchritudo coccoides]NDV61489.1 substrate-binding domain-containing protein [Oceanipulchritudo coccoides]